MKALLDIYLVSRIYLFSSLVKLHPLFSMTAGLFQADNSILQLTDFIWNSSSEMLLCLSLISIPQTMKSEVQFQRNLLQKNVVALASEYKRFGYSFYFHFFLMKKKRRIWPRKGTKGQTLAHESSSVPL